MHLISIIIIIMIFVCGCSMPVPVHTIFSTRTQHFLFAGIAFGAQTQYNQPAMSLFVTHVGGIVKVQTQADRPTETEEPLMKISIIIKSSGFCVLLFLFPCCCFSDTSNTSSRSLYLLHQHFHHHQLLIITYFIVCDYSLREEEEVELSIGCIL